MGADYPIVHKFGGTSVGDAARYKGVAAILEAREEPRCAVVVSAMKGVTDALIALVELSALRDERALHEHLPALRQKLLTAVDALFNGELHAQLTEKINNDLKDIADLMRSCWLLGAASTEVVALVSGYGELWSAQTLCGLLRERGHEAQWLDAREVLIVEAAEQGAPLPRFEESRHKLNAWCAAHPSNILVITGFVASTPQGRATTLGRNGSDYSGAIFCALFKSPSLLIWTDVDGVMSANPRQVPEAIVLDRLSYKEAMELAYFGAKVLHPSTIAPAVEVSAQITIKNTFYPDRPGTLISAEGSRRFAIKGFTTIDDIALLNLEGTHMMGVPGIASRLFGALRDAGVSVIMISQGSSEHSICFAIPGDAVSTARLAVERAFFAERHAGQLQDLQQTYPCSILAAVGDQMAGEVGLAGRFLTALGQAQVNVLAIAQGSSERNISVVVSGQEAPRALRAAHSSFYLSHKPLSLGLIGPGLVGSELLRQLAAHAALVREEYNVALVVRGVATSSRMLLDEEGIDLTQWRELLEERGQPLDMELFTAHINSVHTPHAALIDCTASESIALRYQQWLDLGFHIVTPNKRANTAPFAYYSGLRAARRKQRHYLYETTVGAGLPIIQTLRDLRETGDELLHIEGILSGTLSYLFNRYDGTTPFSQIVAEARALGYTEPDPRDDLSGMDVARKVVILGREMGLTLELSDVQVSGLIPPGLEHGSVEAFMAQLPEHDDAMAALREEVRAAGQVLRFVGRVERSGAASVGLGRFAQTHPFGRVQLTDNIVQFTTRRYHSNPLVVQGPGAGPEVTAGGVFADLLRLASHVGAAR